MNSVFTRTLFIILHAILNFLLITWLVNFDITGKWWAFVGFVFIVLVLAYLFINHISSFFYFLKNKTK